MSPTLTKVSKSYCKDVLALVAYHLEKNLYLGELLEYVEICGFVQILVIVCSNLFSGFLSE